MTSLHRSQSSTHTFSSTAHSSALLQQSRNLHFDCFAWFIQDNLIFPLPALCHMCHLWMAVDACRCNGAASVLLAPCATCPMSQSDPTPILVLQKEALEGHRIYGEPWDPPFKTKSFGKTLPYAY